MVGLVFAGVSAVASQLTAHARAASSLGMAVLGVAFLLRAVGDVRRSGEHERADLAVAVRLGAGDRARTSTTRFWPLAIGVRRGGRPRRASRSGSSAVATSAPVCSPSGWAVRGRRRG